MDFAPQYAQIAIIGGGNMGTACAYQLAKQGCKNVILIEKSELTSGATWHAAGLVSRMVGNIALGKIHDVAVDLYKEIEQETEQAVSWHGCGSLRIATSDAHMAWIHHIRDGMLARGQIADIIGPRELKALNPLYDVTAAGVIGALYTMDDGHVDPSGTCHAMAKGARQLGVKIMRHCRVTNVVQLPSTQWQVSTQKGKIICEHVINAGGYHARQIGAFSGLDLPITTLQHHYVISDNIPELAKIAHEIPVTRDDHFCGYMRQENQSVLIGLYDRQAPQIVWQEGCPWESENALFDTNWDGIIPWLEKFFQRCPTLREMGIKRVVNGGITYTPDGSMLLGPAAGLQNYWLACGATVGISWGPGAGKYLAQWILHGAAEISMRAFDPRRFGIWADADYAQKRAVEDYTLRQTMPYPQQQRQACRNLQLSGAYQATTKLGAFYEEAGGWERPRLYAQQESLTWHRSQAFDIIAQEVLAVRKSVGIGDFSAFAKFNIRGQDAARFLEYVCANQLPQKIGGICLTALLNRQGCFEGEAVIVKCEENYFYFVTGAPSGRRMWDWLRLHQSKHDHITVQDVTNDIGMIMLAGPRARDLLQKMVDIDFSSQSFEQKFPANLSWRTAQKITLGKINLWVLRLSFSGDLAYELHAPNHQLGDLWQIIWQAGQEFKIRAFGSKALDSLRMEKAYPGGHEISNDVTPVELNMVRLIDFKKDFIGKQALQKLQIQGAVSQLVYLEIMAEGVDLLGGEAIFSAKKMIGSVSSGCYGHFTQKNLALAFIDKAVLPTISLETSLQISIFGKLYSVKILTKPAFDPDNQRMRG